MSLVDLILGDHSPHGMDQLDKRLLNADCFLWDVEVKGHVHEWDLTLQKWLATGDPGDQDAKNYLWTHRYSRNEEQKKFKREWIEDAPELHVFELRYEMWEKALQCSVRERFLALQHLTFQAFRTSEAFQEYYSEWGEGHGIYFANAHRDYMERSRWPVIRYESDVYTGRNRHRDPVDYDRLTDLVAEVHEEAVLGIEEAVQQRRGFAAFKAAGAKWSRPARAAATVAMMRASVNERAIHHAVHRMAGLTPAWARQNDPP